MRILLDQGLPRGAVELLRQHGHEAKHVGEIGMSAALDPAIIEYAAFHEYVVVTLDADFHAHLAHSHAQRPSVVRIRIEGLKAVALTEVLLRVIDQCRHELTGGAAISVQPDKIRVRLLPLGASD